MPRLALVALLIVPLIIAGCEKTHTVTFTNDTDEDLQVTLQGPGEIEPKPASLPVAANGGQAIFTVEVMEDDLPANYEWRAGTHRGSLVLHDESKEAQLVHIAPSDAEIRAMDREKMMKDKAEIHRRYEKED